MVYNITINLPFISGQVVSFKAIFREWVVLENP